MGRRSSGRLQLRFPMHGNPPRADSDSSSFRLLVGSFFQLAAAVADLPDIAQRRLMAVAIERKATPSRNPVAAGTMCVARYGGLARLSWRVAGAVDRLGMVAP